MKKPKVTIDLSPLRRLCGSLVRDPAPDPWRRQAGAMYSAYVRRRFKSGNDWQPLEQSTIDRRRKKSSKPLLDTGTLWAALVIGNPGNLFKRLKNGVRFGFGGSSKHPDGKATIADIARYHDQGIGVPKRQIIVPPDDNLNKKLVKALAAAVAKEVRKHTK